MQALSQGQYARQLASELALVLEKDSEGEGQGLETALERCRMLLDCLEQCSGEARGPLYADAGMHLKSLLMGDDDVLWEWSPDRGEISLCPRWRTFYRYSELQQPLASWCEYVHPADREAVHTLCRNARAREGMQFVECRLRAGDGQWRYVRLRAVGVRSKAHLVADEKPQEPIVTGVLSDVTRERFYDPVTGLGNTRLLNQMIEDALNATPNTNFTLFKLSIVNATLLGESDHFTDTYELEARIAELLSSLLAQATPLALPNFCYAFLVNAEDKTFERYQEVLTRVLQQPLKTRKGRVWLSHVIGATSFEAGASLSAECIRRRARLALGSAMEEGVGSARHYDDAMHARANRASDGEQLIRSALASDGVLCFLQPIVSLREGGRVVAFEALMRLRDEAGNIATPGAFIQAAEDTGLIHLLSQELIDKALGFLSDPAFAERFGHDFTININLSRQQLKDVALVDDMLRMVKKHGADPARVNLEITESAVLAEPLVAHRNLTRLRDTGICVALDDFGTGYSSLSQLCELPLDCVKIDRRFVMDLERDPRKRHVMSSMLDLCRRLSFRVVIEGVEESATLKTVSDMGAEQIQGFIFARPMSPEEVLASLKPMLEPLKKVV